MLPYVFLFCSMRVWFFHVFVCVCVCALCSCTHFCCGCCYYCWHDGFEICGFGVSSKSLNEIQTKIYEQHQILRKSQIHVFHNIVNIQSTGTISLAAVRSTWDAMCAPVRIFVRSQFNSLHFYFLSLTHTHTQSNRQWTICYCIC